MEEKAVNFLDLTISLEPGYLAFKPYRKPLNNYERIPYTSAHPLHIKRPAFLGQVSRIARLCSRHYTYYTEISYVRDIYLKYAYPPHFLYTWIRQEDRIRWDSRYENKKEALEGSPFWLKSVYNDVWKHIDLRSVWSAMENSLNKDSTPLAQYESIMLSLRKFRNLGKISNKHDDDQQRACLLEEQRAQQSVSRSPSPTGQMDFNPTVHYRW